jgi:predicted CopG family antitoxin
MKQFLMSITKEKYEVLRAKSKSEGISITELIRRLIDSFLSDNSARLLSIVIVPFLGLQIF